MKKYIVVFLFLVLPLFASAQTFERDLEFGMQNDTDVTKLQEFLSDEGLYSGPITGNFFSLTLTAVKKFQTREGITPAAGYFGPKTRAKVNTVFSASIKESNEQALSEGVVAITPTPIVSSQTTQKNQLNVMSSIMAQIAELQKQIDSLLKKNTTTSTIPSTIASTPTTVSALTDPIVSNIIPVPVPSTIQPQPTITQPVQQQTQITPVITPPQQSQNSASQQQSSTSDTTVIQTTPSNQVTTPVPIINSLTAEPIMLPIYYLKWETKNTKNCFLKDELNSLHITKTEIEVETNKGLEVAPKSNNTYTLRCISDEGTVTKSITLQNRATALTKENISLSFKTIPSTYKVNDMESRWVAFKLFLSVPKGASGAISTVRPVLISEMQDNDYIHYLEVQNALGDSFGFKRKVYISMSSNDVQYSPVAGNISRKEAVLSGEGGFDTTCINANSAAINSLSSVTMDWICNPQEFVFYLPYTNHLGKVKLRITLLVNDLIFSNSIAFTPIESDWIEIIK